MKTIPTASRAFRLFGMCSLSLLLPKMAWAETVGVFFDPKNEPIKFAANDVKTALEKKKFTVEILPITSLEASYAKKKVVIALQSTNTVTALLKAQGGDAVKGLGEQAYRLRTTKTPQTSYWVQGGDANGAMYGGLQIAENISFDGLTGVYNTEVSPTILKRGIKLNLPWDKESPTYGRYDKGAHSGTSVQLSIADVWDMTFWTGWFDEMARNRYNLISLWSCNPFSSLVKVPGYEDCNIENVTYFDGTVKKMTMDQKIQFWQDVMAYAHNRGFGFLIFNWNVFTYGATGKNGITDGKHGSTNPQTIDYMYKGMTKLLETYPHLNGFGMSIGENKGTEEFVWNAYGKSMYDYAKANPTRQLNFIHRLHYGDFDEMMKLFAPARTLPNLSFDISVKISQAHMFSTARPGWFGKEYARIKKENLKTWLTVRNDSFYYHTWGDPDFARSYVQGMLDKGEIFKGFYFGWDGFNPTRTFFHKDKAMNGQLEVVRQKYMLMILGRLTYDLKTPNETFVKFLQHRYPTLNGGELFKAWSQASRGVQLTTELINQNFEMDYKWWPEGCQRDTRLKPKDSTDFVTASEFANAKVAPGSSLGSIADTAAGNLEGKKGSYELADEIEAGAKSALAIIKTMNASADADTGMAIDNLRTASYLSLYYANKIRGATFLKAKDQEKAKEALGVAYGWWIKYSTLMDNIYTGMDMQRSVNVPNWRYRDENVLKEYTDLGGVGIPVSAEPEP
jgi:hypothetical protein